jgi:type IV pilus assembly protein PilW
MSKHMRVKHGLRRAQLSAGRTLVEVMVSLVIGAVILAAILVAVSGTGLSGRRNDVQSRLNDEGQIALNVVSSAVRMAGFWLPASPVVSLDPPEPLVVGCNEAFANPAVPDFNALTCGGAALGHAIAVRYEAAQPGVAVTDCLGNAGAGSPLVTTGRAEARFYIGISGATGNPALFCHGNGGGAAPQAIVDNVETLVIRYGLSQLNTAPPPEQMAFIPSAYAGSTVRYVEASEVVDCPSGGAVANSWCAVTAVRICVVMRTEDNVADEVGARYIDCDGQVASEPDRRIRRALVTTVNLRNRTATVF